MDRMTPDQAYRAMRLFLERQHERNAQAEVAQVLSDTQMLPDGGSADPAALREWLDCVDAVLGQDQPPRAASGG
jgi:hypothetical protein